MLDCRHFALKEKVKLNALKKVAYCKKKIFIYTERSVKTGAAAVCCYVVPGNTMPVEPLADATFMKLSFSKKALHKL